jgi:GNAT superfamily N-acetyltransferase
VTELVTVQGPLDSARLRIVSNLYGAVDARYRDSGYLEHLFARSPAGAALHVLALDEGRPVGHCAVVPMWARRGGDRFRCGKVEALVVASSHRGRRNGEEPVVIRLLASLVERADADGVALLHAFVRPEVGRVFVGFDRVPAGDPSLVAVIRPELLGSSRLRVTGSALALVQRAARVPAGLVALGRAAATLRPAGADDVDLVAAGLPAAGHWTVLAADAWGWYCDSPFVRVLEQPGAAGWRALVQLPGSSGEPLRLVGWHLERRGLGSAVALLRAAVSLAGRSGAATVRLQPWPAESGDGTLRRACRALGFVQRHDFTTLYVRARDTELARPGAVAPTPLLYLGF